MEMETRKAAAAAAAPMTHPLVTRRVMEGGHSPAPSIDVASDSVPST